MKKIEYLAVIFKKAEWSVPGGRRTVVVKFAGGEKLVMDMLN